VQAEAKPHRTTARPFLCDTYSRTVTTAIQRGKFMDPGRSAVFAVFLFLGAYFLGWVRATRPKL